MWSLLPHFKHTWFPSTSNPQDFDILVDELLDLFSFTSPGLDRTFRNSSDIAACSWTEITLTNGLYGAGAWSSSPFEDSVISGFLPHESGADVSRSLRTTSAMHSCSTMFLPAFAVGSSLMIQYIMVATSKEQLIIYSLGFWRLLKNRVCPSPNMVLRTLKIDADSTVTNQHFTDVILNCSVLS